MGHRNTKWTDSRSLTSFFSMDLPWKEIAALDDSTSKKKRPPVSDSWKKGSICRPSIAERLPRGRKFDSAARDNSCESVTLFFLLSSWQSKPSPCLVALGPSIHLVLYVMYYLHKVVVLLLANCTQRSRYCIHGKASGTGNTTSDTHWTNIIVSGNNCLVGSHWLSAYMIRYKQFVECNMNFKVLLQVYFRMPFPVCSTF